MLRDQLKAHMGGKEHSLLDEDLNLKQGGIPTPTVAELSQPYVAPGRKAQLEWCVSYHAYWKNESDGMALHARNQVKALAMTGLPVRLHSLGQRIVLNEELVPEVSELLYLEGVSSTYTAISIKHLIFDTPEVLREAILPRGIRNSINEDAVNRILASTIVYTSWERDRIHREFVVELNRLGQVWVPCEANRLAFVLSGVSPDKVFVVPFTYDPARYNIAAPRGRDWVPSGKRFYHIGKWEPRKNQHRLLGAFLLAFTPKDKASLFIKTSGFGLSWANYPTFKESLEFWLEDSRVRTNGWSPEKVDRLVRVVSEKIPAAEIDKLHELNNIYVSSGLGEAWDIPAFEAKLAGNRLVYVGFGGTEDYAEQSDIRVERRGMCDVHPGYLWEPEAQWADVTAELLAEAMKKAEPVEERLTPISFCGRYSHYVIGSTMFRRIKELSIKLGCWDRLQHSGGFG